MAFSVWWSASLGARRLVSLCESPRVKLRCEPNNISRPVEICPDARAQLFTACPCYNSNKKTIKYVHICIYVGTWILSRCYDYKPFSLLILRRESQLVTHLMPTHCPHKCGGEDICFAWTVSILAAPIYKILNPCDHVAEMTWKLYKHI